MKRQKNISRVKKLKQVIKTEFFPCWSELDENNNRRNYIGRKIKRKLEWFDDGSVTETLTLDLPIITVPVDDIKPEE